MKWKTIAHLNNELQKESDVQVSINGKIGESDLICEEMSTSNKEEDAIDEWVEQLNERDEPDELSPIPIKWSYFRAQVKGLIEGGEAEKMLCDEGLIKDIAQEALCRCPIQSSASHTEIWKVYHERLRSVVRQLIENEAK